MNEVPSLFEIDARFAQMKAQRDAALDQCILMAGEIAVLRARLAEVERELHDTIDDVV